MRKTDEQRGDWKEWRRRRAWELAERGWNQKEIVEALGVTQGAVSQWMKMGREQGEEGLRGKIAQGPQDDLVLESESSKVREDCVHVSRRKAPGGT